MNSKELLWRKSSLSDIPTFSKKKNSPSRYVIIAMVISLLCLTITSMLMMLVIVILKDPTPQNSDNNAVQCVSATDNCKMTLVESIPENLTFSSGSPKHPSTYWALSRLTSLAENNISIGAFYWSLRGSDISFHDNSSWEGEDIFNKLKTASKSNLNVRIAQSYPSTTSNSDTVELKKYGADVRTVNFTRLLGNGVLHTKMWVVDNKHFYVGSANMDWRSLTQVKELGILVEDCTCLAKDMIKMFEVYWFLGNPSNNIPKEWPGNYSTSANMKNPMPLTVNGMESDIYMSSSPPEFCAKGRTNDIDAIVSVIQNATEFVYIAVMDYIPMTIYSHPREYWSVIDSALKSAAIGKKVNVRVLGSYWKHTDPDMIAFFKSYKALSRFNIDVKLFVVPAYTDDQKKIPFGRVNHNKYMVTDQVAYIGTSNWSGDYFINTAGIGVIVQQNKTATDGATMQEQLRDVFLRDWNSEYAHDVDDF